MTRPPPRPTWAVRRPRSAVADAVGTSGTGLHGGPPVAWSLLGSARRLPARVPADRAARGRGGDPRWPSAYDQVSATVARALPRAGGHAGRRRRDRGHARRSGCRAAYRGLGRRSLGLSAAAAKRLREVAIAIVLGPAVYLGVGLRRGRRSWRSLLGAISGQEATTPGADRYREPLDRRQDPGGRRRGGRGPDHRGVHVPRAPLPLAPRPPRVLAGRGRVVAAVRAASTSCPAPWPDAVLLQFDYGGHRARAGARSTSGAAHCSRRIVDPHRVQRDRRDVILTVS